MSTSPRTVLGIDASTQSLSAVLLNSNTGETLWSRSLAYRDDPRLLGFGFEHDTMVMPAREPGEAEQPPRVCKAWRSCARVWMRLQAAAKWPTR